MKIIIKWSHSSLSRWSSDGNGGGGGGSIKIIIYLASVWKRIYLNVFLFVLFYINEKVHKVKDEVRQQNHVDATKQTYKQMKIKLQEFEEDEEIKNIQNTRKKSIL